VVNENFPFLSCFETRFFNSFRESFSCAGPTLIATYMEANGPIEMINGLVAEESTMMAARFSGCINWLVVAGKLIKCKHSALIDLKTFIEVQKKLTKYPISGVRKITQHDEVPLKIYAKDESFGLPFTGYKTKVNWCYKLKRNVIPVNVSAKVLNTLFVTTSSNL
jgi:hypothetical protein